MRKSNLKRIVVLFLSVLLAVGLTGCTAAPSNNPKETAAGYTSGTYTGTGAGRNGELKVEVTFTADEITKVEVVEHSETEGISDLPLQRIPEEIVKNQSLAVDAVATATLTSNAIIEAVADAVTQAGGDAEALKNVKIEKETAGDLVQREADVIVLGGGGAGVAAAYAAAENGASVIVVEKTAALGGNTMRSGGYFNAVVPENQQSQVMTAGQLKSVEEYCTMEPKDETMKSWQEQLTAEFDAYKKSGAEHLFDSVYLHMLQTYVDGDYVGNPALIQSMCEKAPQTYAWMQDMGFDWKEKSIVIVGSLWPRANMSQTYKSGIGFIEVLKNDADKKAFPIEYDLEVKAEEFIVEDGRVTGVRAVAANGTPYEYKAGKGVVLATGGFGANVEMRVKYNSIWADLGPTVPTTNSPAITGDGILMAQEVGANLVGMDKIQLLIADPKTGETSTNVGDTTSMYVNQEGHRFVNESERRDVLCAATLEQTNGMMYIISSYQNSRLDENYVNTYGIHVDDLVERGAVYTADTIEELAEQIGMDPATLRKTVDDYNAAIDAGYDELTGRTVFNETAKIEDHGPYFANPRTPAVHHTMGGVEVDVDAHVLDASGNRIPGLYAAGEVTGGFHGGNRLGGNAISEAITTGRLAGNSVISDQ